MMSINNMENVEVCIVCDHLTMTLQCEEEFLLGLNACIVLRVNVLLNSTGIIQICYCEDSIQRIEGKKDVQI